jgi:hypothetical protein
MRRAVGVSDIFEEGFVEVRFEDGFGGNFSLEVDDGEENDGDADEPESAENGEETDDEFGH